MTIWYRCPELLLGATDYDEKVDIWSAGCILAELLLGKALFPGTNDMEQLRLIFKLMGTPGEHNWEGIQEYPKVKSKEVELGEPMRSELRDKYGSDERFTSSPSSLALIERLLELDPKKRWRAKQALGSQYFRAKPQAPADPQELGVIPINGDSHEFQTKPIRKQAKVVAQKASADAKMRGEDEKEAYENAYREYLTNAAVNGVSQLEMDAGNSSSAIDLQDEKPERDREKKKRKREYSLSKDRQVDTNYHETQTLDVEDKSARKMSSKDKHFAKEYDHKDNSKRNEEIIEKWKEPTEQEINGQRKNRDDCDDMREEKQKVRDKSREEKDRKEKSRSVRKSRRDDERRRSRERSERKHEDPRGRSKSIERSIRMGHREQWRDREPMNGSNRRINDFGRDDWTRGDEYHGYPQQFDGGPPHPAWRSRDGPHRRNERNRR